jgi:hypothetical protein
MLFDASNSGALKNAKTIKTNFFIPNGTCLSLNAIYYITCGAGEEWKRQLDQSCEK